MRRSTVLPVGTSMSPAVTRLYSGYRNSHHHWCPITSITRGLSVGTSAVLKIVWTVGTAMNARMTAGMTVQTISSVVLPWVCAGSASPGLPR